MSKLNTNDDKQIDNVIDSVIPDVPTSFSEVNKLNDTINKKYLNALDKALEIYNFHKITNYLLVTMGIILIFFGLIHGTLDNNSGLGIGTTNNSTSRQQSDSASYYGSASSRELAEEEEGKQPTGTSDSNNGLLGIDPRNVDNKPNTNQQQLNSTDQWISLLSGGAGFGLLVSSFFYKSQIYAQESVNNLAITNMVFKSHYTNYMIIRIASELRLIEIKRNWPEMKPQLDQVHTLPETVQIQKIKNLIVKQQQKSLQQEDLEDLLTTVKSNNTSSNNNSEPKDNTSEPKDNTSEPKDNTSEPKDNTSEPKDNTSEPKDNTSEPKDNTSEPKDNTISNKKTDPLTSFENLITIMTNQTKIHAELLKDLSKMEENRKS